MLEDVVHINIKSMPKKPPNSSSSSPPPYHLHVPIVLKYGSLSLLEPSGPVQACNGTALPLPIS